MARNSNQYTRLPGYPPDGSDPFGDPELQVGQEKLGTRLRKVNTTTRWFLGVAGAAFLFGIASWQATSNPMHVHLPASVHKPTRLHLLFPLDSRSHGSRSCKSLLAALVHGYSPTIINWDLVGSMDFLYSAKIPGVYNFIMNNLTSANDNDLMLMADTYDIWFQQSPQALERRYREMKAGIVIGADQWCWPNDPESPECKAAPASPVPDGVFGETEGPRYANSGTVMGPVSDMRNFYRELNESLALRPEVNDQAFFNEMLPEGKMAIDYWYRLFWTTAGPGEGLVLNIRHPIDSKLDDTIPYDMVPPIVYHSMSGEIPVALHFNMDETKPYYIDGFWGKLWWNKDEPRFKKIVLERLATSRIQFAHDGSTASWHDLCPPDILDIGVQHTRK